MKAHLLQKPLNGSAQQNLCHNLPQDLKYQASLRLNKLSAAETILLFCLWTALCRQRSCCTMGDL